MKPVPCLAMSSPDISSVTADATLALFLDVDGTLLEIAETPDAVVVPTPLKDALNSLSSRLDGALALISGRSISTLDALFDPYRFTAAGIHGCERREASGCIMRPEIDLERFASVRAQLAEWSRQHPGTLLEDKRYALALHYRQVPHLESAARDEVLSVLPELATHELQPGKFVFELRPFGYTKGTAIDAFMHESPFRGRIPLFIGDDVTDEAGFAVVNQLGGLSIRVGEPTQTAARHQFPGVNEVVRWLTELSRRT